MERPGLPPPMRHIRLVAALVLLLAPFAGGAQSGPPPPQSLQGTFDRSADTVNLAWKAPVNGNLVYAVYRDSTLLGTTANTTFADHGVPMNSAFVYFVVDREKDGTAWSTPAVTDVPTLSCDIATVTVTQQYPYVYAHAHQECLGGTVVFDKDVQWTQP